MIVEHSVFPLKRLADFVDINIGKTPSRNVSKYWGKGHKWLSIADMNGKKFISKTKEEITDDAVKETNIKIVPENTVIYSFKLSIGKTGITKIPIYTNEAIASLPIIDTSKLDTKYLYYVMREFEFADKGVRAVMGTTLNKDKLKKIKIPLPPLAEQQRIAKILDAADALRKKTQQIIDSYDELAQSVFLDMFGDPTLNPKGWGKMNGEQYCKMITVGVVIKPASYYVNNGIIALRSLNIKPHYIDLKDVVFFSQEAHTRVLSKSILKENDVVIVRTGSTGTAAVIPKELDGCNCIDLIIARPDKKITNPYFLSHFFNSKSGQNLVAGMEVGGIQKHFNIGAIKKLAIPIPPIELQNHFADSIKLIEKQKELAKQSLKESDDLFNALLQKAFKGELGN